MSKNPKPKLRNLPAKIPSAPGAFELPGIILDRGSGEEGGEENKGYTIPAHSILLRKRQQGPEGLPPLSQRVEGKAGPKNAAARRSRKAPRTAAVTITCPEGKYAETITLARQKIDLSELGVESLKARRAATGAILYEIPDKDRAQKADLFAEV